MITIKSLKEELNKYPDDAVCYAYEGEISGIVIIPKDYNNGFVNELGVIECNIDTDTDIIAVLKR